MTIDNLTQYMAWEPPYRPDPIIEEGILIPETVMMMFGAAGTWKTMNSMHLAFAIARGASWFGFQANEAIVFLHQVELPKYLAQQRTKKYIHGNSVSSHNIFFKTPTDEILLDTTYGIQLLEKDIQEIKKRASDPRLPVVLILDPLYLHMAGHISDEYDVKKFQRNINMLRKKYNLTVIIIHHSRLTKTDNTGMIVDLGAEEIMGSSYWNNWLDTIIRLKILNPYSGSNHIRMSFGKTRNAENFLPDFVVEWRRFDLVPTVTHRDIIEEDEPSIRDLIG